MLVSPGFISQGNQIALGMLVRVCTFMKQRTQELRMDYTDLPHRFFTEESKNRVDFSLPEKLTQVCV